MTDGAVVQPVGRRRWLRPPDSWRSVLRIVLVALWVLWAALSWWTAPRPASVEHARADLSAGRVVAYQWGDNWDTTSGWTWHRPASLESTGEFGPLFAWRTPGWRTYYAALDDPSRTSGSATAGDDTINGQRYSGPEAASLARALESAGLAGRWHDVNQPLPLTGLLIICIAVAALGFLTSDPAPVTGTRWFWFWLMSGVPYGLGLLYWLARERPWSLTVLPPAAPAGKDPRRRWYAGIAIAILLSIAIGPLVYWLSRLLGEGLVPSPGH